MPKQKLPEIMEGFGGGVDREEFFHLPRIEYLINRAEKDDLGEIDKMVINNRQKISDRFSMAIPDNRMAESGICKGDYIVVQKQARYADGDVIVAKLGDRIFIRKYFGVKNRIRLECNTPDRQSMILDHNTPGFSILGCVVQIIREF